MSVFDDSQAIMYFEIIMYVIVHSSAEKSESTRSGSDRDALLCKHRQNISQALISTYLTSSISSKCIVLIRWSV